MLESSVSVTRARPLTSARLVLRPYEESDLAFFHDMFEREDVCRYLPWPPMNLDQARAKMEQRLRQWRIEAERDAIVVLAVEVATGQPVGELMLRLSNAESRQGEMGWSMHPDAQGRGFATEGAREMLRLGFEHVGLHRIAAECDPRNTASMRVMERLGMRREALMVEAELIKGEWVDSLIYAQLESEWRASSDAVTAG